MVVLHWDDVQMLGLQGNGVVQSLPLEGRGKAGLLLGSSLRQQDLVVSLNRGTPI